MRKLALVCMFVGTCNLAYGQRGYYRPVEPATPSTCQRNVQPLPKVVVTGESVRLTRPYTAVADPKSAGNRLQHLLQAANHLEAAGESQQAQRLRQLADREIQTLLNRLATLQAEVARFRQAIGGRQQVLVQVKLLEISRSRMRKLGFDYANFSELAGVGSDFRVFDDVKKLDALLEALRQDGLIRVLAEPTLVTVSGRPAAFHCGGEVPVVVPHTLDPDDVDTASIEHRKIGIELDLLPIVLENGKVRVEIRARHSELDPARNVRRNNCTVPGVRTRQVDTGVEIQAGHTLVLGGLVQKRVAKTAAEPKAEGQTTKRSPTDDKPKEVTEETELLVLITPEIVGPTSTSAPARVSSRPRYAK